MRIAGLLRAFDRAGVIVRVEFVRLAIDGRGRESSGVVRLAGPPPDDLAGCPVRLVGDLDDIGLSLADARSLLLECSAAGIAICVLLGKPTRREVDVEPEFVGFTIDDAFVVGCGIDLAERRWLLPYIGKVE